MNIIIPMAGRGTRLRPHTLTVPKPLIPIAGKPIVQRLVEDLTKVCDEKIDTIGFVIGELEEEQVNQLYAIAKTVGAKAKIFKQDEALGTAHAIYCAEELLKGKTMVAFADTLFHADFKLDTSEDGIIWVQKVEDPSAFGVVKMDTQYRIVDFVEKPKAFVSDLAIIGIYYFREAEKLKVEIEHLLDKGIKTGGEYGLTDALEQLRSKGLTFKPGEVNEWLDCGNKDAVVFTNQRYLEYIKDSDELISPTATLTNTIIIPPVYIGKDAVIENSVIGPHVSIGDATKICDSRLSNSLVQANAILNNANLQNSMLGNAVSYKGPTQDVSLGDYTNVT